MTRFRMQRTWPTLLLATAVLSCSDERALTESDVRPQSSHTANIAPTADPAGPYSGFVKTYIRFDGRKSTDPDGSTSDLRYYWNFGDGTTGTGSTPSHYYNNTGTYTLTLRVRDAAGAYSQPVSTTVLVMPPNKAPVAVHGGPYTGNPGVPVQLDGSASSDPDGHVPLTYRWSFGDGTTITTAEAKPTRTYTKTGTFTIALRVYDRYGKASTEVKTTVTITTAPANQRPVAQAGGPYSGTAGSAVAFDGSGSTDPDWNLPLTYAWNFGDGNTGSGATPSHTYATGGTYTVTLTVADAKGLSSTPATATATIAGPPNQQPTAHAGGPYDGTAGSAVTFDGRGSSDPDGNEPLSYEWNFGDGSTGSGPTPAHSYASPGTYTVTLSVTDTQGLASTPATTSATIAPRPNQQPIADAGGPYSGTVGSAAAFGGTGPAIKFDGTGSRDPDGDLPLKYAWDFGDGNTGNGATPSHSYAATGTYTVTLTVTDDRGLSSPPATTTATIAPAPNEQPVANAGGPYSGKAGSAVTFDGTGSLDPDGDLPLTYAWDFGDGASGTGAAPKHTYATAGNYTVTLTVTDDRGLSSAPATTTADITTDILFADSFSRVVTNGWGNADIGGAWAPDPTKLAWQFRVDGSRGVFEVMDTVARKIVGGPQTYGMNVEGLVSVSVDRAPDGLDRFHMVQVFARRNDLVSKGDHHYRFRLRIFGKGTMDVNIEKQVQGAATWLTGTNGGIRIPYVFSPGAKYWIRWEAIGTSPATTLRMRVWPDGMAEPSTWSLSLTHDEPALDVPGTTGVRFWSARQDQVTFPIMLYVDDLKFWLRN